MFFIREVSAPAAASAVHIHDFHRVRSYRYRELQMVDGHPP
jgi:hypothetical protein